MAKKRKLSLDECEGLGIRFSGNIADNGEHRFRLAKGGADGGFRYTLVLIPEDERGWQKSHYHERMTETRVVQKGWVALADLMPDGSVKITVRHAGSVFTTPPGQRHNIYMSAGSVIHIVKHGDCSLGEDDWFVCPELDVQTKCLSEEDIFRRSGMSTQKGRP